MNFSGLLKIALPIAVTIATGGAAAPAMATLQQLAVKAAVQIAIQKLGQEMGLPPSVINMAQLAAGSQMGGSSAADFGSGGARGFFNAVQSEMSPIGQGSYARSVDQMVSSGRAIASYLGGFENAEAIAQAAYDSGVARELPESKLNALEQNLFKASSNRQKNDQMITDLFLQGERNKLEGKMKEILSGKGSMLMKLAVLLGMIADQKMSDMMTKAEQIGKFGEVKGKNQAKFQQLTAEMNALSQELNTISNATANVIKTIGEASTTLARK